MNDSHMPTTANDTSNARERFVSDLQTLSSHAQELLQVTSTVSGESIAAAREQLQESIRVAGEHLKHLQQEAMDRGRKVVAQADSYVHENPWPSIAMGMAAGVAIGLASSSMARGFSARH